MRINDVEIFSIGKHHEKGDDFTLSDLEGIVAAHGTLDYKPAVKIGHAEISGAPAYGYLERIRESSGKLVGDLVGIPSGLYDAISAHTYSRVSVELFKNLKRGNQLHKYAIKAIALLGQEVGAVSGLRPLSEMEFGSDVDVIMFNVEQKVVKVTNIDTKKLDNAIAESLSFKVKLEAIEKENEKLKMAVKSNVGLEKDKFSKMSADVALYQKKIESLESESLNRNIKDKLTKVTIPALRPAFDALYRHALVNTEQIQVFSVSDKKNVTSTLEETLDSVVEFMSQKTQRLFSEVSTYSDSNATTFATAGEEVVSLVDAYIVKNPDIEYKFALNFILDGNNDLKERYFRGE